MSENAPTITASEAPDDQNGGHGWKFALGTAAGLVGTGALAMALLFPETLPPVPPTTRPPNAQELGRSIAKDTTRPPIPPIPDCPRLPEQKFCRVDGIAVCTARDFLPPGCTPAELNAAQRRLVENACRRLNTPCNLQTDYCGQLRSAQLGAPVCEE